MVGVVGLIEVINTPRVSTMNFDVLFLSKDLGIDGLLVRRGRGYLGRREVLRKVFAVSGLPVSQSLRIYIASIMDSTSARTLGATNLFARAGEACSEGRSC